ncbi:MAG: tRNA (uridine(34)/cytosine(34)/5-carboxymethylaminomethyluridine(34)-2'-O)-methyltransferase TrmL [Methylococcaceae bacterium]|nr:tRNA (uridine(34)/cytosine(34)/5-carboxymethylaminomethyluridine(34)-2'-O)-methyltransferase TrmL [Methylococcaceae bacterium]
MLHIVLHEPDIPANTGNIIRLCANTGAALHLIEPLGFELDDKKLRRAGLDYHEWAHVQRYSSLNDFIITRQPQRMFALTTKGSSIYSETKFQDGDVLLFGSETRGLPAETLDSMSADKKLYLPMQASSRSLNLSNTVAIVLFEAWKQLEFTGGVIK